LAFTDVDRSGSVSLAGL